MQLMNKLMIVFAVARLGFSLRKFCNMLLHINQYFQEHQMYVFTYILEYQIEISILFYVGVLVLIVDHPKNIEHEGSAKYKLN